MSEHFIYGIHAVSALLANPQRRINQLIIHQDYRTNARLLAIVEQAENKGVAVRLVNTAYLQQHFVDCVHQGVIALTDRLPQMNEHHLDGLLQNTNHSFLILILDGITDPHNLGACLRTAEAAGVDFVIIPKDKNAQLNATVAKVACGAAEVIPLVTVTNLARVLEKLKKANVWIYGAAGEASASLYQLELKGSVAIVMGAEGTGLRRLTRTHCDALFSIPMNGVVSSLNVSVATGVSLYEVVRQRQKN